MKIKMNDGVELEFRPVPITNRSVAHYVALESKGSESLSSLIWLITRSLEKGGYSEDEIEQIFEDHLVLNSKDPKYGKDLGRVLGYITAGEVPEDK